VKILKKDYVVYPIFVMIAKVAEIKLDSPLKKLCKIVLTLCTS